MDSAYESALATVREATLKFDAIRNDYRAMKIGDAEFLAARAEYLKAEAVFDEAYSEDAPLCDCCTDEDADLNSGDYDYMGRD